MWLQAGHTVVADLPQRAAREDSGGDEGPGSVAGPSSHVGRVPRDLPHA